MGFAVFWVIFALVIATGASSRGRSGVGWFLVACLISPLLAGILLLFLPVRSQAMQLQVQVIDKDRYACPNCAEAVKIDANVCIHCGTSLDPVAAARAHREGPVDWLIKNAGKVFGILVLASFGYFLATAQPSDKTAPSTPAVGREPEGASKPTVIDDDAAISALIGKDQLIKFKANLKDPIKVAIIECMGVKIYQDPQPTGHPPPAGVCDQINAFTKARLAEDPKADIVAELRDFVTRQLEEQRLQQSIDQMKDGLREMPDAPEPNDHSSGSTQGDKPVTDVDHQP